MADPGVGIVIAIIAVVVRVAIRLALKSRHENQYVGAGELDDATRRLLASPAFDARAETRELCTGPGQATVMLFDVDDGLMIDGVEVSLPPPPPKPAEHGGGYREASVSQGRAVAIMRICPGRHTILARSGTRRVATDLFLHPQEVWARRVPAGEGAWDEVGSGDVERARRGLTEGTTAGIAYSDQILPAIPTVISVDVRVKRTLALCNKVAAMLGVPTSSEQEIARLEAEIRGELNGAGLTAARIESLVSTFGSMIWETRANGGIEKAIAQTRLALAILPDEPRLLALLGETEKALGRAEEGRAHLTRALARGKLLGPSSLDASWTARVEAALA